MLRLVLKPRQLVTIQARAATQIRHNSTVDEKYSLWTKTIQQLRHDLDTGNYGGSDALSNHRIATEPTEFLQWKPSQDQVDEAELLKVKDIPIIKDDVVDHCINMVMKDGKKSQARKRLSRALYLVYLNKRKNPVEILKDCLDNLAPLMKTKTMKTGFAKNVTVPTPLSQRQRNRIAFQWILEGSDKRKSNDISVRLSEEILSVYEGKSSGFEKKALMHKQSVAHRGYLKLK